MSFVQERERRPNAGSRMRALIDQEVDMEELFEYKEDDEEDEEFSAKIEEEEEDKVDSDFDLESSEGEQEHIEEGKAMDKEIEQAEKKARRAATFHPPTAAVMKPKKMVEKRKRVKIEDEEERSTRYSSRKNTMLNRILLEDQIREDRKKKALLPKRERPVVNKLTQEELLAEAAITEEQNKHSLLEWQQKEAERKENAKKKEKKGITGEFVRYYSFADGKVETLTQDNNDWQMKNRDLMGRNLISFMDSTKETGESSIATQTQYSSLGTETADADKDLGLVDLIDQLSDWLEKVPKPNKPTLCPVSGEFAKYRDPHTNVPYANMHAYELVKSCLHHDMKWSSSSGLYLGQLPSAKGVPDGWNSSI